MFDRTAAWARDTSGPLLWRRAALPSAGVVLLNGVDLHANRDALKQDIAFVPKQDVLHEQPRPRHALDYVARLQIPPPTATKQRRKAANEAACSIDVLDRLDQCIGALSGGKKNCASLASEISAVPTYYFLTRSL